MIEEGLKLIVDTHFKTLDAGFTNWVRNLPAVLWVNQSIVRTSTRPTPYYISYDNGPIGLGVQTWRILLWNGIHTTSDNLSHTRTSTITQRRRSWRRGTQITEHATRGERATRSEIRYSRRRASDRRYYLLHNRWREKDISQKLFF